MKYVDEICHYVAQQGVPTVSELQAGLFPLAFPYIAIPSQKIVFQIIHIPLENIKIDGAYFQQKSLEYRSQGIQLVQLWQDQWMQKQDIVKSRVAALVGNYRQIHARNTKVIRIPKDVARRFMEMNHLQGAVASKYSYGLYDGDLLVAVALFSAKRPMQRDGNMALSYELLRYAGLVYTRVVGGIGKLLAQFIRDIQPDDIMTYADLDWATGKGYEMLHFQHVATVAPQMFWIHPEEQVRYYPHRLPLELINSFNSQSKVTNMDDFLEKQGYIRIYNAGNLKYLLDSKTPKP